MATTATVSIASDIWSSFSGINKTMTLTQAGTTTDIDSTTGFSRRKLSATSSVDLITMANELVEPDDNTAAKIYIKNIGGTRSLDKTAYVTVTINAQEIGRLYGDDWLMMPLTVVDGEDVVVTPSTDDTVILEYAMFYEEA